MKVFDEETVQKNPAFFIAGRGGETNLHQGNHYARQRVLSNAAVYAGLKPRDRGQKFAMQLLHQDLAGFTFVVRLSYFRRNYENGRIAPVKLASIISEHGSLDALEHLPETSYVSIGETWCLNIIGAILRQAACRGVSNERSTSKEKTPRSRSVKRSARTSRANKADRKDHCTEKPSKIPDTSRGTPPNSTQDQPCARSLPVLSPEQVLSCSDIHPSSTSAKTSTISNANTKKSFYSCTRRVSWYHGVPAESSEPMKSAPTFERMSFFPLLEEEQHVPQDRALRLPRLISEDWIPERTPTPCTAHEDRQDALDPFDAILKDYDTEKWPQLDLHDLLSV